MIGAMKVAEKVYANLCMIKWVRKCWPHETMGMEKRLSKKEAPVEIAIAMDQSTPRK
jgi:hypothetical protein